MGRIRRLLDSLNRPVEIRSASGVSAHVEAPRGPEYFRRIVTAEAIERAAAARARIAKERR